MRHLEFTEIELRFTIASSELLARFAELLDASAEQLW